MITPRDLGEDYPSISSFEPSLSTLKEAAQGHIAMVLRSVKGDRGQAAQILGISVRQLRRRLAQMKKDHHWKSILEKT
jgi:DNA-binding NtrC family response regulator